MNKWLGYVPGVCWSFLWDPHATWVFFSQHLFVGPKFRLVSFWIRFCPMLGKQVKILHLFHPKWSHLMNDFCHLSTSADSNHFFNKKPSHWQSPQRRFHNIWVFPKIVIPNNHGVLEVLPFKETPISVPGPSPPWHSSHQSSKIQPEELSKRNFVLVSSLGSQKKENRRSVSSYVMEIEKGCLVVALDSDVFFLEVVWLLLGEFTVHVIFDMYWYLWDVFTSI